MSNFMESLKTSLDNSDHNVSTTANGALGYRTTGSALLDLNFSVSSLRDKSNDEIIIKFMKAFDENSNLALKWLFFARDIREGLGERRLFRIILMRLSNEYPELVSSLIPFISEYGRWDDVVELLSGPCKHAVVNCIRLQWGYDYSDMRLDKPISLMAKWLPSVNTSSRKTVAAGRMLAAELGYKESRYRKILSALRKHIDVLEIKMSKGDWDQIDYEKVPSRANLIYSKAFLRNDETRRRDFLTRLTSGEAKINAGTLYPHDIVHRYLGGNTCVYGNMEQTLEGLWNALPNAMNGEYCRTMVVADGSGSMDVPVSKDGRVTAIDIANALAIYFAERMTGEFQNKYITFSRHPQLVDLTSCNTLYEKLKVASYHREVSDTNIEAVFELILKTAVDNNLAQYDMPRNILIISDMEFNSCGGEALNQRLFEAISEKYTTAGYRLPRLIFWNVNSSTGTIPIKENKLGVSLVSGFSPNVAKMIMSEKMDPYECLVETLMSERYLPITDNNDID